MLLIKCPICGVDGDELEFTYGHQAHIERPEPGCSDADYEAYLFYRDNPKGVHAERWLHANGCGKWFHALRDTVTMEFKAFYGITEPRPDPDGEA